MPSVARRARQDSGQIEYLVLAVATGQLARGEPNKARTVLDEAIPALAPGRRNLPWFEYLRRVTGAK